MHSFNANIVTILWEERVQKIRFIFSMFICTYVCKYVYIYIRTHARTHTQIYIYIYSLGYAFHFRDLNTGLP